MNFLSNIKYVFLCLGFTGCVATAPSFLTMPGDLSPDYGPDELSQYLLSSCSVIRETENLVGSVDFCEISNSQTDYDFCNGSSWRVETLNLSTRDSNEIDSFTSFLNTITHEHQNSNIRVICDKASAACVDCDSVGSGSMELMSFRIAADEISLFENYQIEECLEDFDFAVIESVFEVNSKSYFLLNSEDDTLAGNYVYRGEVIKSKSYWESIDIVFNKMGFSKDDVVYQVVASGALSSFNSRNQPSNDSFTLKLNPDYSVDLRSFIARKMKGFEARLMASCE